MTGWIDKAKDFIKGHPDQAQQAIDKVEDLINEKTGGKYTEQVEQGADAIEGQLGLPADEAPAPAPTPTTTPAPAPAEPASPQPSQPEPPTTGAGNSDTGQEPATVPSDPGDGGAIPRDPVGEPGDEEIVLGDGPGTTGQPSPDNPGSAQPS